MNPSVKIRDTEMEMEKEKDSQQHRKLFLTIQLELLNSVSFTSGFLADALLFSPLNHLKLSLSSNYIDLSYTISFYISSSSVTSPKFVVFY